MSRAGPGPDRPIVFLHVPKTAGQTVHHALAHAVGKEQVSPIMTHTQAAADQQFPQGYSLYSGHIDWVDLESLPAGRFVFTVIRDPRERLASFYFFLHQQARLRSTPGPGIPPLTEDFRRALDWSVDAYFTTPEPGWQSYIRDHFDNFFCAYYATRRIRGRSEIADLGRDVQLARARAGLSQIDAIYRMEDLRLLERDMHIRYGVRIRVANSYQNVGTLPRTQSRWSRLMALTEQDATRRRLEDFVAMDQELLADLPPARPEPLGANIRRWARSLPQRLRRR